MNTTPSGRKAVREAPSVRMPNAELRRDAEIRADAMELADLIRRARTAANLSQSELARRAGLRQEVVSAFERGIRTPGGITLTRIARALGLTLGFCPR